MPRRPLDRLDIVAMLAMITVVIAAVLVIMWQSGVGPW